MRIAWTRPVPAPQEGPIKKINYITGVKRAGPNADFILVLYMDMDVHLFPQLYNYERD